MICKNCKTEYGYVRFETKEWVCRKCGTISKIKLTMPEDKKEGDKK